MFTRSRPTCGLTERPWRRPSSTRPTFPNWRVTNVTTLHDTPSGDADVVSFELFGQPFMATSAGPLFKFTPALLATTLPQQWVMNE